ncbi:PP2C family protein-serine/threonine phosphatase [Streptomyces fuscigenes]|uniref:PP2C family protein-serine/threonine phosphatase n=1 Tax=Streptomyces fuscigenes TaxID=1528880 RepID=UPI001F239479|nr:PP2C family protein-serine/threonine phosphatase [Streptomyces fuscigenes]MCF3962511.1 serine/threonine-protein phosphatase [Streptomyces fuscigenes]
MFADLLRVLGTTALDDLPDTVGEHARTAGFTEVRIYVGDVERRALHLITGTGTSPSAERRLPIADSEAGRAYQYGRVLRAAAAPPRGGTAYWVPMFNGQERVGLMYVASVRDGESERTYASALGSLVALAVSTKRWHSDTYARLNRTEPMNVAAEAQWHLMPPRTYTDSRVAVCATLEPSYRISGDAYDYATDGSRVHLSIFDAMGHDTAAGQTAALALAAARSARRRGAGIVEMGEVMEEELLARQFEDVRYATALLAALDTDSGVLEWASFGHHPPLVLRAAGATLLDCKPAHPLGTGLGDLGTTVCREQLEPGDRIALYTDGITEARRPHGQQFGLDRFVSVLTRYPADGLSVSETVRRFAHAFLDYHNGVLQDDATVLLCEWRGPGPPLGT